MSHHHNDDGCGHEHAHSHDHDQDDEGNAGHLFSKIDLQNVTVLNSEQPGSYAIKPWHERLDNARAIESDADDQLIIRIPFTGAVKLRTLLLRSGPDAQTPSNIRLFPNYDNLDFDDASDAKFSQEFQVVQTNDVVEYPVKPARFSNVRSITLFIPASQGADEVRISYISFKGEFQELKEQPVITIYEAQANLSDHEKVQGTGGATSHPAM